MRFPFASFFFCSFAFTRSMKSCLHFECLTCSTRTQIRFAKMRPLKDTMRKIQSANRIFQQLYYNNYHVNLPNPFIYNNTQTVRGYIVNTPSFSMVTLMRHAFLEGPISLNRKNTYIYNNLYNTQTQLQPAISWLSDFLGHH